jgi:hypothetical protein
MLLQLALQQHKEPLPKARQDMPAQGEKWTVMEAEIQKSNCCSENAAHLTLRRSGGAHNAPITSCVWNKTVQSAAASELLLQSDKPVMR